MIDYCKVQCCNCNNYLYADNSRMVCKACRILVLENKLGYFTEIIDDAYTLIKSNSVILSNGNTTIFSKNILTYKWFRLNKIVMPIIINNEAIDLDKMLIRLCKLQLLQ